VTVLSVSVPESYFLHGSSFCPDDGGTNFLHNFASCLTKHDGNYDV